MHTHFNYSPETSRDRPTERTPGQVPKSDQSLLCPVILKKKTGFPNTGGEGGRLQGYPALVQGQGYPRIQTVRWLRIQLFTLHRETEESMKTTKRTGSWVAGLHSKQTVQPETSEDRPLPWKRGLFVSVVVSWIFLYQISPFHRGWEELNTLSVVSRAMISQ